MDSSRRGQRWAEATVMACGAVPVVTIGLHAYSDTPQLHPQPSYGIALLIACCGVLATPFVAWLLRRRLAVSWLTVAGIALTGPLLVVASGVMRARAETYPEETAPVVGAVIATAGYLAALTVIAILPLRRLTALIVPLVVALAVGHIGYGLSPEVRYEIAGRVGHPYPTPDAATVIYGHQPYFD